MLHCYLRSKGLLISKVEYTLWICSKCGFDGNKVDNLTCEMCDSRWVVLETLETVAEIMLILECCCLCWYRWNTSTGSSGVVDPYTVLKKGSDHRKDSNGKTTPDYSIGSDDATPDNKLLDKNNKGTCMCYYTTSFSSIDLKLLYIFGSLEERINCRINI